MLCCLFLLGETEPVSCVNTQRVALGSPCKMDCLAATSCSPQFLFLWAPSLSLCFPQRLKHGTRVHKLLCACEFPTTSISIVLVEDGHICLECRSWSWSEQS